jgi:hypothetical protein
MVRIIKDDVNNTQQIVCKISSSRSRRRKIEEVDILQTYNQ